jgi:hypothetical protein
LFHNSVRGCARAMTGKAGLKPSRAPISRWRNIQLTAFRRPVPVYAARLLRRGMRSTPENNMLRSRS